MENKYPKTQNAVDEAGAWLLTGKRYKKGGLLRVLKDSGFNHHKGSPKNELKHNRGQYIATIGKDNMGDVVNLDKYTPNTKRFISSTSFDNPKKLADYFNKNQLYAKGGNLATTQMDYDQILEILKDKIDDTVEDLYSTYENSNEAVGEEVESKSRDGFIPFTNGGYSSRWFEYSNMLEGSGIGLPTKSLDDKIEEFSENNRKYAKERFEEDYPKIVEELGIENIDYHSLYNAGYGDEAEELSMYETDDDDTVMMEIQALYYNPENDRGEDGNHTIRLSGVVNLEAPYHRTGNLEDYIEKTFTFSSIKDLEDKLDEFLAQIKSWFEGDMYSENSKELKIRKMSKGGKLKTWREDGVSYDEKNDFNSLKRNEVEDVLIALGYNVSEDNLHRFHKKEHFDYIKEKDVFYRNDVNDDFAKGGKIGFDGLAKKVAKNYSGKKVPKKFQNQYGKTYSPAEAKEVGDKVAGSVYRMQQAKKMAKGGKIKEEDYLWDKSGKKYIVNTIEGDTYYLDGFNAKKIPFSKTEVEKLTKSSPYAKGGKIIEVKGFGKYQKIDGEIEIGDMAISENGMLNEYVDEDDDLYFINETHTKVIAIEEYAKGGEIGDKNISYNVDDLTMG